MTNSFTSLLDVPQEAAMPSHGSPSSARLFENYEDQKIGFWRPTAPQAGQRYGSADTYTQTGPSPALTTQVRALQKRYTIVDADILITDVLSEHRSLYSLLIEAVKPLHETFGEQYVLQLRAQLTDEGSLLRAVVQLPQTFDDPETALRGFDTDWWLNNCHRSGGALVFDYEIQDAV